MATMKCTNCGYDTAVNATVCPRCGARPPHGGARANDALIKMLGTIVAIFVLGKILNLW